MLMLLSMWLKKSMTSMYLNPNLTPNDQGFFLLHRTLEKNTQTFGKTIPKRVKLQTFCNKNYHYKI